MTVRGLSLVVTLIVAVGCANGTRWERTMEEARTAQAQGRNDRAEQLLLSALAQAERLHRLHPYQLETNTELARLYFKQGSFEQAKAALLRLIARLETLYVPEHPGVGSLHADFARACDRLGQLDEAASHYQQALPAALRSPGRNELDYLYLDMAANAARRGLPDEARLYLDRAVETAGRLHPGGAILAEIQALRAQLGGGK